MPASIILLDLVLRGSLHILPLHEATLGDADLPSLLPHFTVADLAWLVAVRQEREGRRGEGRLVRRLVNALADLGPR